jgi:hypothetical protein
MLSINNSSWPTKQQELLFKASLLQGGEAIKAWETWVNQNDIENLDYGSQRLLPLLFKNISTQGVDDPVFSKIKGVHRHSWYKNQILFAKILPVIQQLNSVGIQTLALKGAALAIQYYDDFGLRPMDDFDILVRNDQAEDAIQYLQDWGWRLQHGNDEILRHHLKTRHASAFVDNDGHELDLHWHLLIDDLESNANKDFWDAAEELSFKQQKIRIPNPTDLLLQIILHGNIWEINPPIRWVPDAFMVLNSSRKIDWQRLLVQAKKRKQVLRLREALIYLVDILGVKIPSDFWAEISEARISIFERRELRVQTSSRGWAGHFPKYWFRYCRNHRIVSKWPYPIGFVQYLQNDLGFNSLFGVIGYGLKRRLFWLKRKIFRRNNANF